MRLLIPLAVAAGVFIAAYAIRAIVARRAGEVLTPATKRSMSQLALLLGLLAGLTTLVVILRPSTADTLLVSLVRSAPQLLLAALIVVAGAVLGRVAGTLTERSLRNWSSVVATRLGRVLRIGILAIAVIIALDQIGVSTELLVIAVAAAVSALALAFALAAGLGSVPLARQVAAGRHVQDRYVLGQWISSGDIAGTIVEIGLTATKIETDHGVVDVPNEWFLSQPIGSRQA